jgi:succinate dehydrogenase/fumarate reductase flavoprotein subunit
MEVFTYIVFKGGAGMMENEFEEFNTIIIGSGAAGLNCALHLVMEGLSPEKIAIVTDQLGGGTSFNTGSDKQTYYKLSTIGENLDSPYLMAKDFFQGGAMHGDIALIEATNSVREFFHLVNLGVQFPHDKYGAYVGYKTDNDPRQRATSVGPLTSQEMGNCLLKEVKQNQIQIYDQHYALKLIIDKSKTPNDVMGVICFKKDQRCNSLSDFKKSLRFFKARNVILATGGPAILYKHSVYPPSQTGTTLLAIEAGCKFQNLTESQFGLASLKFRWNLSGSYQQVIPRYFSIDESGQEVEFLTKIFPSFKKLSNAIFLKGYQWPFNASQIKDWGSSLIDLSVYYQQNILNRKIFLDFRRNPKDFNFDELSNESRIYLENCNAIKGTPFERLKIMNEDAIKLYQKNEIDLSIEPIEIGVCNQHLNGGIIGDIWWETNIKHLFAIGEINGSHGIHRPGGAALNSGQVGGLRAAQKIARNKNYEMSIDDATFKYNTKVGTQILISEVKKALENKKEILKPNSILKSLQETMNKFGSIIRPYKSLNENIENIQSLIPKYHETVSIVTNEDFLEYFQVKDALLTHFVFLKAIEDYHNQGGESRGSFLILRENLREGENIIIPPKPLDKFEFISNENHLKKKIQTLQLMNDKINVNWIDTRPIPKNITWFENVWQDFKNKKIYD